VVAMKKKIRFLVSPNLSDGVCKTILIGKKDVLNAVESWLDDAEQYGIGNPDRCSISTVYMTDEEFEKLPEL
jgi:hypothetical protein